MSARPHLRPVDDPDDGRGGADLLGSGLGGIAAAKAGAVRVLAADTDPFSVAAVTVNAAANGVALEATGDDLLAGSPDVTFGRYTGETEEDRRRAQESFGRLHPGEPVLANEMLSRAEMRTRRRR